MIGRRGFLVGGGAFALALAAVGYRAWNRGVGAAGEGPAYEPWRTWEGGLEDGLLRPLRAAILAANPHDTQPWAFAVGPEAIEVFADRSRNLGSFDPFRREMHLGLGAAIENLAVAARAYGMSAEVEPTEGALTPSPDDAPFRAARVVLRPRSAAFDALTAAIPIRHTNRGPYRPDQPLGPDRLQRLADLAASAEARIAFVTDAAARRDLGAVIIEATGRIIDDPEMSADSARWFRTGAREIAAHRDGVTLDAAGLSPPMTALAKLLPDMSAQSSDKYWLGMTRDVQLPTAPALGVLFVRDRLDMGEAIAAGRAWQRLHLAATAAGLAAQPLNQPVERADRDRALGRPDEFGRELPKFSAEPGWEATFVFRLGVPERPAPPSPRRGLEEVLRTGA
jgi:nitroreductase